MASVHNDVDDVVDGCGEDDGGGGDGHGDGEDTFLLIRMLETDGIGDDGAQDEAGDEYAHRVDEDVDDKDENTATMVEAHVTILRTCDCFLLGGWSGASPQWILWRGSCSV